MRETWVGENTDNLMLERKEIRRKFTIIEMTTFTCHGDKLQ